MTATEQQDLKEKLKKILEECYKKAATNKLKDVNFKFPDNISNKKYFESKIKILLELDVYSKTFLSIHTRAKLVLREFQENKFEDNYLELLRLVLTLNDAVKKKKSIKVEDKLGLDDMIIGKNITVREEKEIKIEKKKTKNRVKQIIEEDKKLNPINGKTRQTIKVVRNGMTGKKLQSIKKREEQDFIDVSDIEI